MGATLYYMSVLGLVVICLGIIRLSMTIFGFKKIRTLDHTFELWINKNTGFKIRTQRLGMAIIVLGIVMVVTPCAISASGLVGDVKEAKEAYAATPTSPRLEEGGYEICCEEITIDLRNKNELSIEGFLAGELSDTVRLVKLMIKDVESDVEEINLHHATSGYRIQVIEKSEKANWRRINEQETPEKIIYNPFAALLKGRLKFKDLLKRRGGILCYYMIVPVTARQGQEIMYRLKYRNAFQGDDFDWPGKVVSANTDVITMNIAFPENKPFKSGSVKTSKKNAPQALELPINKPEIETTPDNRKLTWKIKDAKKGEMYLIKWQW